MSDLRSNVTPLRESAVIVDDPLVGVANTEAEQSLLGALLINNKAWDHVCDLVRAEDFANPIHGRIYAAIGKLLEQGAVASPVSLHHVFDRDGALVEIGGSAYLGRLVASVVSILNAPYYARTVADLARRRSLILLAQDIQIDAAVVEDPNRTSLEVLDDAAEKLHALAEAALSGGPESIAKTAQKRLQHIEAAYKAGGIITVDTGLTELDRILSGLTAGDLDLLGGRPSMGKSAFASTIAFNAARQGKTVLYFSLEMSKDELTARWMAGVSGIDTDAQRHGKVDMLGWDKLTEAQQLLAQLPIHIDDQARLSVSQMRQRARRIKRRHGLSLIIVDHLQLVRQGGKQENRRLEIGDISSSLKAVAKELEVPILALSQLSRAVEQREDKRPVLSDLRESGDLEQDADVVMFLYREEYYVERAKPKRRTGQTKEALDIGLADWEASLTEVRGQAELLIPKNRHGRTGYVRLAWDAERQRFENLERVYPS